MSCCPTPMVVSFWLRSSRSEDSRHSCLALVGSLSRFGERHRARPRRRGVFGKGADRRAGGQDRAHPATHQRAHPGGALARPRRNAKNLAAKAHVRSLTRVATRVRPNLAWPFGVLLG